MFLCRLSFVSGLLRSSSVDSKLNVLSSLSGEFGADGMTNLFNNFGVSVRNGDVPKTLRYY